MKRLFAIFVSLLLSVFLLCPISASAYVVDDSDYPFGDIIWNLSNNIPDMEEYPYWMIAIVPFVSASGSINYYSPVLHCFSCSTELVYFQLKSDGYYFNNFNENSVQFSFSNLKASGVIYPDKVPYSFTFSFSSSNGSVYSLPRCVFDNFNVGQFPFSLEGNPEAYKSHSCVLYSNFDIYGSDGRLLQYANTEDFKAHAPFLRDSLIDYTSYVPPTTYNYEVQEGDSETLQTSKGIYARVQDVIQAIANLPSRIAESLSSLLSNLKDGLLDGLKYLFVPSDNLFTALIERIHSRFNFVFQLIDLADYLIHTNFDSYSSVPPDFTITLPDSWGGRTYQVFSPDGSNIWIVFSQYRTFAHNIIIAITTYLAIRKAKKRLPALLNGEEFKS